VFYKIFEVVNLLVIGDIHANPTWKKIIKEETFDEVIFIGDYFDNKAGYSLQQEWDNFLEIVDYKKTNPDTTKLLIGNHDFHYIPGVDQTYSGYKMATEVQFKEFWTENQNLFQIAYQKGEYLFTHAGVSPAWLEKSVETTDWQDRLEELSDILNDLFRYTPRKFYFQGPDPYGYSQYNSPIWIRPDSLEQCNKESEISKRFIQVVGHTIQDNLRHVKTKHSGEYLYIDTLNTSGEYLKLEL
jgi:predicted phosphodiesterase